MTANEENINFYSPEIIKPERTYSRKQTIFAFVSLFMGFGFVHLFLVPMFFMGRLGLGAAIYFVLLTLYGALFPSETRKNKGFSLFLSVLSVLFSVNIFLTDNLLIQFLDAVFAILIFMYNMLIRSDEKYSEKVRELFVFDMIKAVFLTPFHAFGSVGDAISQSISKAKETSLKKIGSALLGLLIAIPSTVAAAFLLSSADEGFAKMIDGMFSSFDSEKIMPNLFQVCFGLPIAFGIFSICLSSSENSYSETMTDDSCRENLSKMGIVSVNTGFFAVLPPCVLYVIFIFSQTRYFFSAFSSSLPDGFSYAEYARRGFFELAAVTVINVMIISAFNLFCRHEKGKRPLSMKIITAVFCFLTIMLAVTAISKMVMYIDNFGLTPLRIYTTWFMALIVLIFVSVIAGQFVKLSITKISVIIFTGLFAALSFCRVDYIIADYNIRMYENGKLSELDSELLSELSADACTVYPDIDFYGNIDWRDITLGSILWSESNKK